MRSLLPNCLPPSPLSFSVSSLLRFLSLTLSLSLSLSRSFPLSFPLSVSLFVLLALSLSLSLSASLSSIPLHQRIPTTSLCKPHLRSPPIQKFPGPHLPCQAPRVSTAYVATDNTSVEANSLSTVQSSGSWLVLGGLHKVLHNVLHNCCTLLPGRVFLREVAAFHALCIPLFREEPANNNTVLNATLLPYIRL